MSIFIFWLKNFGGMFEPLKSSVYAPDRSYRQFEDTEYSCKKPVSEVNVERIKKNLQRDPWKSTNRTNRWRKTFQTNVWRCFEFNDKTIQVATVTGVKPNDKLKRVDLTILCKFKISLLTWFLVTKRFFTQMVKWTVVTFVHGV